MNAYYAEMSEWFKEHDWKSCVGLKPTGGSNPLLCAKKDRVEPVSSARSFHMRCYAIISRNFAFRLCYRSIERDESKREKLLLL